MLRVAAVGLLALSLGACAREAQKPEGGEVAGVVRDSAGAPIRGAFVMVSSGPNTIARLTDGKGAYDIQGVKWKNVQVTASHLGYGDQTTQLTLDKGATADFKLPTQFDAQQLTAAEILTTLPHNGEVEWLKNRCISCHGITQPGHLRGATEQLWLATFKTMQLDYGREDLNDQDRAYAAKLAVKYFGPDAPPPTMKSVRTAPLSDEALKATYYTVDLPVKGRALPHSVVADNQGGAWVAEYGAAGNAVAHWDLASGKVDSYPLKTPNSGAHTPTVDHDGRLWTTLLIAKQLAVIDPKTKQVDYVPLQAYPHTLSTDKDGFIWGSGQKVFRLDPKTKQIAYWDPMVAQLPEGSWGDLARRPDEKPAAPRPIGSYHVVRDSKGFAWYTSYDTGWLTRLDPRTGETKVIKNPGVPASRGIDIDAKDVVWYSNWGGHGLAKYDQATGENKLYKLPTEFGMVYSVKVDKKRGYVWLADFTGNHITRFDPKTEQFVEYPLPHNESYPRFISVDDKGRIWFGEWWNSRMGMLDPGY